MEHRISEGTLYRNVITVKLGIYAGPCKQARGSDSFVLIEAESRIQAGATYYN